ncbi:hypothetical protein BH11VER1_BH11VER1_10110 [soil metagenome]
MDNASSPSINGWQRGFWSLMATQFQNAFSDNALKNLIILLVLARPMSDAERNTYVVLAGALFAAPFILFSMFGGWLADRFSKKYIMNCVKLAEIGIMLFAALSLMLKSLPMELVSVFFMGCHSAIFGPSKYGILPEVLPLEKLSWGNGILELLTFLGIIFGTVAGAFFAGSFTGMQGFSGLILMALAFIGWRVSLNITPVAAADPHCPVRMNPITDLYKQLKVMKKDRDLWRANWGNTGFYFIAALVQMNLLIYAKDVLHLSETHNGMLSAALALGIGIGSVAAGFASRGHIEYRLVPIGAAGLALSTIPMGMPGIGIIGFTISLLALGFSAGLFIVPIAAVLQHRPPPESKGAVQGAVNLLSFIGILAASAAQWISFETLHLTPGQVFWVCGGFAILTGAYAAISRKHFIQSES